MFNIQTCLTKNALSTIYITHEATVKDEEKVKLCQRTPDELNGYSLRRFNGWK